MKKLLPLLLLINFSAKAQFMLEPQAGVSTRFYPTVILNTGYILQTGRDYGGVLMAATGALEAGFGYSYGGYIGWQFYAISFYAGAAQFEPLDTKTLYPKLYPIGGVTYRYPDNIATLDLRYQQNTFIFSLGVRLPDKNHRR